MPNSVAPDLISFRSRFPIWGSVLRVTEPMNVCCDSIVQRMREGTYDKPFIVDVEERRCLHFNFDPLQSAMLIAAPHSLALTYTQQMMSFLLFNPVPERILLLGLGGGSLAKYCYRRLPETNLTTVEIDPRVIRLRDEFQIPHDDSRFNVICQDAALYVEHLPDVADVILMDAVGRNETNALYKDRSFYQNLHRVLSPDGILVINMFDGMLDWAQRLSQLREVFRGEYLCVRAQAEGNVVLLAFKSSRGFSWQQLGSDAVRLERDYGLDFPDFVRQMSINRRRREHLRLIG
jgi:spermidine synthase